MDKKILTTAEYATKRKLTQRAVQKTVHFISKNGSLPAKQLPGVESIVQTRAQYNLVMKDGYMDDIREHRRREDAIRKKWKAFFDKQTKSKADKAKRNAKS